MPTRISPLVPENLERLVDSSSGFLVAQIAADLRAGGCPTDRAFDRFMPDALRRVSSQYWTPLVVVVRAARWFQELGIETVVDIGAGAGKFCVAMALAGNCRLIGVEHRAALVDSARQLAELFEVEDRVEFIEAVFGAEPIPSAQAYYLYNPFGENIYGKDEHLDEDVELSEQRFHHDVAATEGLLRCASVGTYVLTYNGFGGRLPAAFREVRADSGAPNPLRLLRKEPHNGHEDIDPVHRLRVVSSISSIL